MSDLVGWRHRKWLAVVDLTRSMEDAALRLVSQIRVIIVMPFILVAGMARCFIVGIRNQYGRAARGWWI